MQPISNRANQSFQQGKHFFNQWNEQNSYEAAKQFRDVIALEPEFLPAYNWLTKTFIYQAGRGYEKPKTIYPEAIEINSRALTINSESGEALVLKGLIDFFYLLDWHSCYEYISKGLISYQDKAEVYQQLSLFWYGMQDYDQSLAALNAAMEFDPVSIATHNMIGDVHISKGAYTFAEKKFQYILKLNHDNPASLENLGYIHTINNHKSRAFFFFNKLLRRLGELEPVIPRLGFAYGRFGLEKEVEQYIRRYEHLALKYPHKVYHNQLSQVFAGLGDWNQVMQLISEGWQQRTGILYILTDPILQPVRQLDSFKKLTSEIIWPKKLQKSSFQDLLTQTNQLVRVNIESLLYLEADDNYVTLFLNQNFRIEKLILRQTLSDLL